MRVPAVRDDRHDRLAAANRGDRESAAEALGQCGQVRVDAEVLLRASPGEPEPGDDLIEDQQGSMQLGEFAQQLEIARLRQDAAGVEDGRLGDDRGHFVAALRHHGREALWVIPGQHQHRALQLGRDTGTGRHWPGAAGRAGHRRVYMIGPVARVLPAVIMPLESDDQASAGIGPGDADGATDRLAARVGESDQVDAGNRVDDLAGRFDLELIRQAEAGAIYLDRIGDRRGHYRVPVTEDHRAEAEQVVHELVAVHVADPRPGAAGHERRVWLPTEFHGPGAAARAARNNCAGLREQLARAFRPGAISLVKAHASTLL